ncbi:hypothetical protein MIB92_00110 [Aestuariirhabdus sp. Z084]|uniref:hypothetical protein n=1 Tax=Aestuariirhabdus haliotis TaxID=2918751 RepID=UPI00201B3EE0|nr:hypothetical protein [Aestuariirhabdus haliotis]MCL6414038.1 hypothetical protein [Aestuariirhabdus haliotis]MCL6417971.1 hypothetical protein [Aestuariirhabdus haliotis]
MKMLQKVGVLLCLLVLAGCASKATWEGMNEDDISSWKSAGFSAEAAQMWGEYKFNATEAAAWRDQGFEARDAARWAEEKFTAEQAGSWKQGDFDLDDAIDNRAKGLSPIKTQ